jgi:hypothetical protein
LPTSNPSIGTRPQPPASVLAIDPFGFTLPAPEVWTWVSENILSETGLIHNPDHEHLRDANLGFLWTSAGCASKGRQVVGMAETPAFRCNQWQRARQEQQLREWFGDIPDFVITLDAYFCEAATDAQFLALLEHELYHCAQAEDEFGAPRFNKQTGEPVFTIRGHDVEEFVGVVRRYGVVSDEVQELVDAAQQRPEVARVNIARACGTCVLKSA